ncbi:MAG TPA: NlpC/P60 family protein [Gaiellaceae bacterium]|jgi:cell wall-associated NlpC family hydrolase|nr:NlpC/P60 family protein [Gaiellaceae bacterium]
MRRIGLALLCTLVLASVAATAARAHPTPQIRAEQAHAKAVVAEINQIGRNLETVIQEYDSARLELQRVKASLRRNEFALHVARGNLRAAQKRLMNRVYSLYVNGSPSYIDVIAGAKSLSQMIDRAESAQVLSNQDAALSQQAQRFEHSVQLRQEQLTKLKHERETTVASLATKRSEINSALARQKQLLASIHSSIQQLQQQEAEREARLRAEAQARLKAQLEAQAAARAAAAQPAQTTAPPPTSTTGVAAPPVSVPVANPGVGHPQAASIALQYLGVPYVWGGSSPSGFDCSGLVMYVYGRLGISLPHYTVAQWSATTPISMSQIQPGDLVFFDGLGHVGIYIGNGQFVHAPHTGTVVQIASLSGYYASALVGARRVP